jgi:glycosyltransferase involved in cell wall biosynthesis
MHVAFITVGDPTRLTGGYLYHRRVFSRLRTQGMTITEISASAAERTAQIAAAATFGQRFDPADYDLIVVDALARGVVAAQFTAWQTLRPVIAMVHELPSVANNDPVEMALEEPLLSADRLIAVSKHGQHLLLERGAPAERIRIVSPGRDRLVLPAQQLPSDTQIVLCVAQWIERKGIVDLVTAWGQRPRPNARLVLVGETNANPDYTARVATTLHALPASAPATVYAASDDATLAQLYAEASVFALPSFYEGYGMVFAEALTAGLPVVAYAAGPLPDLIGSAGLLAPVGDRQTFEANLTRVLSDATLHQRLSLAATQQATQLPTWAETTERFLAVLHEAVR